MRFRTESISAFQLVFDQVRERIRAQPGCHSVELLQDVRDPGVLFTYSVWDNEEALNAYRQTDLFVTTWKQTRSLFSEKAEAWTVQMINQA